MTISKKIAKQFDNSPTGGAIAALLLRAQGVKSLQEAKDILIEAENIGKLLGAKRKNDKTILEQKGNGTDGKSKSK